MVMPSPAQKVAKPWGYELIFAHTDRYVGKVIFVRQGEELSLQYHERKDETMFLLSGEAELVVPDDQGQLKTIRMRPETSYRIPPLTKHRLIAVTDCQILEASTPELDDVVRLEDRYGRAGK